MSIFAFACLPHAWAKVPLRARLGLNALGKWSLFDHTKARSNLSTAFESIDLTLSILLSTHLTAGLSHDMHESARL